MIKKRSLSLIIVGILLCFFSLNLVHATALDLKITGEINNLTSDLWLKTNANAELVEDAYDLRAPSSPDGVSVFSSSVSGITLSIDSYGEAERTFNLSYVAPSSQTGDLTFSWDSSAISSSLVASLKDYGSDSTYTTQVGTDVNMRSSSSYATEITDEDSIYVQIVMTDYVAPAVVGEDAGGGGGGGGGAPSKIVITGNDVFIGDKFIDAYMKKDSIKNRQIDLYNQADETLTITLSSSGLGEMLDFEDEDLNFVLAPKERKQISFRIISPSELGSYDGMIKVNSGKSIQTIEVDVTVTEEELWFDAEVAIPWDFKIIQKGAFLPVQLNLLPVGLEEGFDVKTSYTVKDSQGGLWLDESKEFFVNGTYDERIDFATQNLPVGQYVLELTLEYPNGVATSRSSFEVREGQLSLPAVLGSKFIYLLFGIAIIIILIAIILIVRSYKKIKKHKRR
jgi:hypothetical protein